MSVASKNGEWEPVIGLEMHARLLTRSKIFSGAASGFCETPNAQICEIDLGMPGVLPTLNRAVVDSAIVFGLAVGGKIAPLCEFARKNYFYPDLSKGYQISQYEHPIVSGGRIEFADDDGTDSIDLTRAHLEEDAGQIDARNRRRLVGRRLQPRRLPAAGNRHRAANQIFREGINGRARDMGACALAGDLRRQYARRIVSHRRQCVVAARRLANARHKMRNQKSQFVSLFNPRARIRNQTATRDTGERRRYHATKRGFSTRKAGRRGAMRDKEDADDYRYFPDPDLPPLRIGDEDIERLRKTLPPPAAEVRARVLMNRCGLTAATADLLIERRGLFDYFMRAAKRANPKQCANWICGDLTTLAKRDGIAIEESRAAPENLAELIALAIAGEISGPAAKETLAKMWKSGESAKQIVDRDGLRQTAADDGEWESLAARIAAGKSQASGAIRGRQTKGDGMVCRPSDEANRRQSRPETAEFKIFARLLAPAADD